jgi:enoyl-CoA hydratase/carnithine racemase
VPRAERRHGGEVRLERDGGIATLVLDHPRRRNAISFSMWGDLEARCRSLEADPDVLCVVVRGAGSEAFVSGADVSEFGSVRASASAEEDYAARSALAFAALMGLPMPTVALIHGFCMGGGVALALACDLRYAAPDAVFSVPAARLGLGYSPEGIRAVVDLVGPARTKEIFFTARRYSAQEALAMGLVDGVFPKDALEREVHGIASSIAQNAPLTLRAVKMAVREVLRDPGSRDLAAVREAVAACFQSQDYREGVKAFLERRPPRFRGR